MAWEEIWADDKLYFDTYRHYYDSAQNLTYKQTHFPYDREAEVVKIEYRFVLFGPIFILHGTYTDEALIRCEDESIRGGVACFHDYLLSDLRTQDLSTGSVTRLTTGSPDVDVYLDLLFAFYKAKHQIIMSKNTRQPLSTIRDLVFASRDTGKHIRRHNPEFDPYVEIIRKQLGL